MGKLPKIDKLNEAITVAEEMLETVENGNTYKSNRKRKRITKALENAYATLNMKNYTEREIKSRTDEIWTSIVDDDPLSMFLLFLTGFALSGVMIFTIYQTYSLLENDILTSKTPESYYPILTEETSTKVKVNYIENNIISLYEQMSTSDAEGLQSEPQRFTISNSSKDIGKSNYFVKYDVSIEPLNDPKAHLLREDHIKLKYTYVDDKGVLHESEIMTLSDLSKNADGSLHLIEGEQPRDSKTEFKVYFWISSHASNEEQGATYTLKFRVDAAIGQS